MKTIPIPEKIQDRMLIMKIAMLLFALVIVFSFISSIVAGIYSITWFGLGNDFDGLDWEPKFHGEDSVCHMPGCGDKSTARISYTMQGIKAAKSISIENTAGFDIDSGTTWKTKTKKAVHKEEYIKATYVGKGTFILTEEEERYEYRVKGDKNEIYYQFFGGDYCDEHKDQAVTILKEEIRAAANKNVFYFVGQTLSPYQYLICFFMMTLCYQIGFSIPIARLRMERMTEKKEKDKLKDTIDDKLKNHLAPSLVVPVFLLVVLSLLDKHSEQWFGVSVGFGDKLTTSLMSFGACFPAWSIGCIVILIIGKRQLKKLQN